MRNKKELLEKWKIRMELYRVEYQNAPSVITKCKAFSKFITYRDCIKELKELNVL